MQTLKKIMLPNNVTSDRDLFILNVFFSLPAPTTPMAKMELCDTSASLSCDNLLRVSIILSCGLEADRIARANGTARRITGSPYCSCKKTNTFSTSLLDDRNQTCDLPYFFSKQEALEPNCLLKLANGLFHS